jgi:hypothetical protein
MKRTYLFFIPFFSILAVALMTGQPSEDWKTRLFKDFVSHCRDHKLSERVNEYRAKIDTLKNKPSRRKRSQRLPWPVAPLLRFPALSLLPAQIFAHEHK